jgi:hypothetical protein
MAVSPGWLQAYPETFWNIFARQSSYCRYEIKEQ